MDPKDLFKGFGRSLSQLLIRDGKKVGVSGKKLRGKGYTRAHDPRKKKKLAESRFKKRKRLKRHKGLHPKKTLKRDR